MCLACLTAFPEMMRQVLLAAGVPEEQIDLPYPAAPPDLRAVLMVRDGRIVMTTQREQKTPGGNRYDVDLGDGHYLAWSEYNTPEGTETSGGLIFHARPGLPECFAGFTLRNTRYAADYPSDDTWLLTGHKETPTLSPSFRCHCGDHGYVREGRWERA